MNSINNNNNPVTTINVIEESLRIEKQLVEKAKIKIVKKVYEEDEAVNVSLMSEDVEVKNVPLNMYVAEVPPVRYEGATIIVPVIKEVLVVETKLLLVEEVHITKHKNTVQHQQTVTLKKQEVTIERIPSPDSNI